MRAIAIDRFGGPEQKIRAGNLVGAFPAVVDYAENTQQQRSASTTRDLRPEIAQTFPLELPPKPTSASRAGTCAASWCSRSADGSKPYCSHMLRSRT